MTAEEYYRQQYPASDWISDVEAIELMNNFININNSSIFMIQPIARYIAIKHITEEIKSSSGLIMSAKDASDMRYQKAEVVAVGDEVTNIKTGDIILYDKSNSYTMLIGEEQITIIQFREVVAIV